MPRIIVTEAAVQGLEDCRRLLASRSPDAARRAAQAIGQKLLLLETSPDLGRPLPDAPEMRELVIAFGDSGYVAKYRHDTADDALYILALRVLKQSPGRPKIACPPRGMKAGPAAVPAHGRAPGESEQPAGCEVERAGRSPALGALENAGC